MGVQLQSEGGFGTHEFSEVRDDKGVWRTEEVCDEHTEKLRIPLDDLSHPENTLARFPVHILAIRLGELLLCVGNHIEGEDRAVPAPDLLRDALVGLGSVSVVGPSKENDEIPLRVPVNLVQEMAANVLAFLFEGVLGPDSLTKGLSCLFRRKPQFLCQIEKGLLTFLPATVEVDGG